MVSHDESLLSKTSGLSLSRFYNRCIDSLILMFLRSICIISSAEDEPTKLVLLKIGFLYKFLVKLFREIFFTTILEDFIFSETTDFFLTAKNWIEFNGERELQTSNVGYLNIRGEMKFLWH